VAFAARRFVVSDFPPSRMICAFEFMALSPARIPPGRSKIRPLANEINPASVTIKANLPRLSNASNDEPVEKLAKDWGSQVAAWRRHAVGFRSRRRHESPGPRSYTGQKMRRPRLTELQPGDGKSSIKRHFFSAKDKSPTFAPIP
jgi:hypothetical protein